MSGESNLGKKHTKTEAYIRRGGQLSSTMLDYESFFTSDLNQNCLVTGYDLEVTVPTQVYFGI